MLFCFPVIPPLCLMREMVHTKNEDEKISVRRGGQACPPKPSGEGGGMRTVLHCSYYPPYHARNL